MKFSSCRPTTIHMSGFWLAHPETSRGGSRCNATVNTLEIDYSLIHREWQCNPCIGKIHVLCYMSRHTGIFTATGESTTTDVNFTNNDGRREFLLSTSHDCNCGMWLSWMMLTQTTTWMLSCRDGLSESGNHVFSIWLKTVNSLPKVYHPLAATLYVSHGKGPRYSMSHPWCRKKVQQMRYGTCLQWQQG